MYYDVARVIGVAHAGPKYECPICGYKGRFLPFGVSALRLNAACPQCGAVERQRMVALWFQRNMPSLAGKIMLHFAPEPSLMKYFKALGAGEYITADINVGRADLALNIEDIAQPAGKFDLVLCNHVLEHVDDAKALAEIYRILTPGGRAILTVPIIDSWQTSYEPGGVETDLERVRHFGQRDHIRFFGRDFDKRIEAAGFKLEVLTADGPDSARFGLVRGESLFVGSKV